jgi:hypothetical protein
MKPGHWLWFALLCLSCAGAAADDAPRLDEYEAHDGFVDIWWDATAGRVLMRVDELDAPFLYQSSLPRGVGSNDIGLDRGQLGDTKVVRFLRSGPKILLVEDNLRYRANSDNAAAAKPVPTTAAARRSGLMGIVVFLNISAPLVLDAYTKLVMTLLLQPAGKVGERLIESLRLFEVWCVTRLHEAHSP